MLTTRQLHDILGMGWDGDYNSLLTIRFHEQDGGKSDRITAFNGPWDIEIKLNIPVQTAHLPQFVSFKINELRALWRILIRGYSDLDCVLPLQLTDENLTVLKGPGRNFTAAVVK